MRRLSRPALACAFVLGACSSSEPLPIPPGSGPPPVLMVRVPATACDDSPLDQTERVGRFRVSIDGVVEEEHPATPERAASGLPVQPRGERREALITVEVLEDGGSPLLAIGWVRALIDPEATGEVTVPVYAVERTSPILGPDGRCARLATAKAGHRATLLDDGRVIFTGGVAPESGGPRWLEEVEGLNPHTGAIGAGPPARAFGAEPRAWHGAVKLKNGRLLIFGGERQVGDTITVTHSALVYDPLAGKWAVLDRLRIARSRANHGIDGEGRILIAGGFGAPSGALEPLDSYEWFDPEAGIFNDGLGAFPTRALGAMEYLAGTAFVLAGGRDGSGVRTDALALKFNPAQGFMPESTAPQPLTTGRSRMAHAKLGNDWLLAAGGTIDLDLEATDVSPSAEVSLVAYGAIAAPKAPSLPRGVVDACAVAIPAREGDVGRVLVMGGLGEGGALDDAIWEVVRDSDGQVQLREVGRLATARFGHTCTALKDGSVVIAGGFTRADRSLATDSVERFVPANVVPPTP